MAQFKVIERSRPGTTWRSRAGQQTIFHLDRNPVGLRVVEHKWADEPTARVSVFLGDGRRPDYQTLLEVEGVEPGQGQALFEALGGVA